MEEQLKQLEQADLIFEAELKQALKESKRGEWLADGGAEEEARAEDCVFER